MVYSQQYSCSLFHSSADKRKHYYYIITMLPLCTQMMFELIKNLIQQIQIPLQIYSHFSHIPYLASLFTIIYFFIFYPLPSLKVPVPCYFTIERGPVYLGEPKGRSPSYPLYNLSCCPIFPHSGAVHCTCTYHTSKAPVILPMYSLQANPSCSCLCTNPSQ
jgi:hypothetical protein